jgi:hypothetical protein
MAVWQFCQFDTKNANNAKLPLGYFSAEMESLSKTVRIC